MSNTFSLQRNREILVPKALLVRRKSAEAAAAGSGLAAATGRFAANT